MLCYRHGWAHGGLLFSHCCHWKAPFPLWQMSPLHEVHPGGQSSSKWWFEIFLQHTALLFQQSVDWSWVICCKLWSILWTELNCWSRNCSTVRVCHILEKVFHLWKAVIVCWLISTGFNLAIFTDAAKVDCNSSWELSQCCGGWTHIWHVSSREPSLTQVCHEQQPAVLQGVLEFWIWIPKEYKRLVISVWWCSERVVMF